jgi:hypothetical protein
MKVALVCIAKDEDNYIDEWIVYHTKLGFDKIFVYQNDWQYNIEYDIIEKIEFNGSARQIEAYNEFMQNRSSDFEWICFLDVDEFITLKKHKDIKSFIEDYKDSECIALNWHFFGDNTIEFDNEYSVIKRFKKRHYDSNGHVKTIVKTNKSIHMEVHAPNINWVDVEKNVGNGPFSKYSNDSIAFIAHFFCKTEQEFTRKVNRGRADILAKRPIEEYNIYNISDIEDLSVYNFMYGNSQ